jgi:hypothetical protein
MTTLRWTKWTPLSLVLLGLTYACSQSSARDPDGTGSTGDGDGDGTTGATGPGDGTTTQETGLDVPDTGDTGSDGQGGAGPVCERASSAAELPPIYLGFAFDVSGSMGKLDRPNWWHDPSLKWAPVVEATTLFFADATAVGISASLTLFPAEDDACDEDSYLQPGVAMTSLPSTEFAAALRAYEEEVGEPLAGGDWRGGTPTHAALLGVASSLSDRRTSEPNAKFAVVLVTDGMPQSCDEGLEEVQEAAAELFAEGLPTYVIGIQNPTTPPESLPEDWDDWGECDEGDGGDELPCAPPDSLDGLNDVANAGGTERAFLIDTGNPDATQLAFRSAIEAIRDSSLACSLTIPPHPTEGMSFDKDKIDVTVTRQGIESRLGYDATCTMPDSWHYDEEEAPRTIQLCEQTCASLKATTDAKLEVEFLCEPRPDVIR